jgi:hypothetical protein
MHSYACHCICCSHNLLNVLVHIANKRITKKKALGTSYVRAHQTPLNRLDLGISSLNNVLLQDLIGKITVPG